MERVGEVLSISSREKDFHQRICQMSDKALVHAQIFASGGI